MYGSMERSVSYNDQKGEDETYQNNHGAADNSVESGPPESQPPITFADLGIPTGAQLQDTVVGVARPLSDISWKERVYVFAMLIAILTTAGFTIYRVSTVDTTNSDFVFGLVLILNAVCLVAMVIDGVLRERPSELFILSVATVFILVYMIVNFAAGSQGNVKLARLVVACVLSPFLFVMGLIIAWEYHVSKHLIFRTVGANEMLQNLYRHLLVFQDCLKLDVQLAASMILLIVVPQLSLRTRDIVILSVGGAITFAWFFLGFFAFPKESKISAILFLLFSPAEIGYVCYKMYDVSHYIDAYPGLAGATIACGVLALCVRLIVIAGSLLVFRGFGNGLKEKLQESPRSSC